MSLMRLRFGAVVSPHARGDTQRPSSVDTDKGEGPSSYNAPHLARNAANFTALTPLTFLPRAATVYPDKLAVVHGATGSPIASSTTAVGGSPRRCAAAASTRGTPSPSWRQTYRHCSRRITAFQWQGRF